MQWCVYWFINSHTKYTVTVVLNSCIQSFCFILEHSRMYLEIQRIHEHMDGLCVNTTTTQSSFLGLFHALWPWPFLLPCRDLCLWFRCGPRVCLYIHVHCVSRCPGLPAAHGSMALLYWYRAGPTIPPLPHHVSSCACTFALLVIITSPRCTRWGMGFGNGIAYIKSI